MNLKIFLKPFQFLQTTQYSLILSHSINKTLFYRTLTYQTIIDTIEDIKYTRRLHSCFSSLSKNTINCCILKSTSRCNQINTLSLMTKSQPKNKRNSHSVGSISSWKTLSSVMSSAVFKIIPIKALQDNYMYLLIDDSTKLAAAIDPVNPSALASYIHDYGCELKMCLTTHHHHDHAGGNAELKNIFPTIEIYGGDLRIPGLTKVVGHGTQIQLGDLCIQCLSTPCHTKAHICYYITQGPVSNTDEKDQSEQDSTSERAVFTGDTLFVAGCGRFFEGTPEQMDHALNKVLGELPPDTKVYCGHEYTVANLKFALSVEPHNVDIKRKLSWAQDKVSKKEPTIPSSIGEEKKINPFMRLKKPAVREYTGETEDVEVMANLRHAKNESRF